ncbi:AraC family transcriptional regulator [Olivibacter sp. SDN3]|uniref:AraC family transcriptional regulator n=1 Tax=Olivibacter sp. SDN3 TaxID=2764720 RepID=UPI0016519513|nr:helix-turn-helix domain-containing protein [Olivibacter sp. SDN3]QNL49378.1 AraC family transcriptional regulator [Olivibacter sp. SDN3]
MTNNHICHIEQINLSDSKHLDSLVEHRRVFTLQQCELNIFETFHRCHDVALSYQGLVISSMMRGKKIMTLAGQKAFDFMPGESIIIPEGVTMKVDFPDADERHPVQCATLALDWDMVNKNIEFLNEYYPNSAAPHEWKLNFNHYHFTNNKELAASLNRLIKISMEEDKAKDALADLALKYLLLRVIQTQNLVALEENKIQGHRLTPAIRYINEHLTEKITIEKLAKESCMSRSAFFEIFKQELGLSPTDYIIRERMELAKRLMADESLSISDICYRSGFNNPNYFIRLFKRSEGFTPNIYRK